MNINLQLTLVTKEQEVRLHGDDFTIVKEGYVLYPINELIGISKKEDEKSYGKIIIKEIAWKENQTIVFYQLKSLSSVN